MRNSRGAAEPEIRPGEMDYLGVGGAIECIDVEVETAHCEDAAIARDRIKDVAGTRSCDTKHYVATTGIDKGGAIILCYQG